MRNEIWLNKLDQTFRRGLQPNINGKFIEDKPHFIGAVLNETGAAIITTFKIYFEELDVPEMTVLFFEILRSIRALEAPLGWKVEFFEEGSTQDRLIDHIENARSRVKNAV